MKLSQVAVQLYTLRDFCKNEADFATTIKRVKAIGYQAVQISGVGPIPPADLRRICAGEGVVICATHEGGASICDTPQLVIDRLGALGCRYTAYSYPHLPLNSLDDCKTLAPLLDRAGDALRRAGMTLCYHNHDLEFRRFAGKTVLQWIFDLTDPRNLQGEPDTYWVQAGGCDPTEWCARLHQRLPLLHMKDYGISAERKPIMHEVGNGNLNWRAIVAAAETSGCEWYIVEQDICPADPFESIRQSFAYISSHLAAH
jgi:sugar phosphate isomerase/epimerase